MQKCLKFPHDHNIVKSDGKRIYIKKLNSNAKTVPAWSHILFTERKQAGNYYISENIPTQN